MRPYGIPSLPRGIDLLDIRVFGLKSSYSQLEKHEDSGRHNSFRRVSTKAKTRRVYKRAERQQARREIAKEI